MNTKEQSSGGSTIYRHQATDRPYTFAKGDETSFELISQHVEKYIGPIQSVFHEIVSDLVHIDILYVAPTKERNYITLVTSGMSNLPMTVPEGAEAFRYAELIICLPPDWELSNEIIQKEENYWPIRILKMLARLPHEYNTWLYAAHTIPNNNPPEPYASNTKLMGMMLTIPSIVEQINEFFTLTVSSDKEIHFFSLTPLYSEEMDYKLKHGAEALFEKLDKASVNELLDPRRKNTCKKLFGLF
ncbi:suppressor of fused domain protein [Paenibacillus qinlingensis]|uniref:suppressor of fused domain protein n=1 Tax=Paenibacillus qinlingensis TaxID=1837343 RepID=UPI001564BAE1|nr:suppressor of fused domain protein [Paenibacillus qinlingensis]NQX63969.1 suppressor of fused domain protein [Paenibacillus qinlingensis]